MTGTLIGANQAFAGRFINNRYRSLEHFFGLGLVTSLNGVKHLLHGGAEIGALAGVKLTMGFRLAGALSGLC